MVRFQMFIVIYMLLLSVSFSIMIKDQKYTKISEISLLHLILFVTTLKADQHMTHNVDRHTSDDRSIELPKDFFNCNKEFSRRQIIKFINPIQGNQIESLNIPGQYASISRFALPVKNEIKPVGEPEFKLVESMNCNINGYSCDRLTTEKIKMFNNHDKMSEYSSSNLATLIAESNRLIQSIEKGNTYNSVLHLPTNPILALILSHYGKYTAEVSKNRLYSYAASNNVHNNKPFGQYKYEIDEV